MDMAEYETNTLLFDNFSRISYRRYALPTDLTPAAVSSLISLEHTLRSQKYLTSIDLVGRALWHFHLSFKDQDRDAEDHDDSEFGKALAKAGHHLDVANEGKVDSLSYVRSLNPTQAPQSTELSSSLTADSGPKTPASGLSATASWNDALAGDKSTPSAEIKTGEPSHGIIYENFIATILHAVGPAFCAETGALLLNSRTVLFPSHAAGTEDPDNDGRRLVLGVFRVYLTTAGSLVLGFSRHNCEGLRPTLDLVDLPQPHADGFVLVAPFGVHASIISVPAEDDTAITTQTPQAARLETRVMNSNSKSQWQKACTRILQKVGVPDSFLTNHPWIAVTMERESKDDLDDAQKVGLYDYRKTVPWPGSLCFSKRVIQTLQQCSVSDDILHGYIENHDALGTAKWWFDAAPDREEQMAKEQAERQLDAAKEVSGDRRSPKTDLLRRPRVPVATQHTMYPTPPDALHNPNWISPSGDGMTSSPGHQAMGSAKAETDDLRPQSADVNEETMVDDFDFQDTSHEPKRERSHSNLPPEGDTGAEDSDMFDNMGGDMFGDNDVTEADFSFFDAEPDHPVANSPGPGGTAESVVVPSVDAQPTLSSAKSQQGPSPAKEASREEVFAKPELRHARSSQADFVLAREQRETRSKRDLSPFDPQTVFKRVRASMMGPEKPTKSRQGEADRHSSSFVKLNFDAGLPLIDQKYRDGGHFDFKLTDKDGEADGATGELSTADYLLRQQKIKKYIESMSRGSQNAVRQTNGDGSGALFSSADFDGVHSDDSSDNSSEMGGESDTGSDTGGTPMQSTGRGTRADDDNVSQGTSLREVDNNDEPDERLAMELPRLARLDISEVPVWKAFAASAPLAQELHHSDEEFMEVAQLLTEQAATSSFNLLDGGMQPALGDDDEARRSLPLLRSSLAALRGIADEVFGTSAVPSMKNFLEVQDSPSARQPSRLQPRPIPGRDPNAEPLRPHSIYRIPGPHLEVRRADTKLSVLPSAASFWESLGLGPSFGAKDVEAVCAFPAWKGVPDRAQTFLNRLKNVYESLKLGEFREFGSSVAAKDQAVPGCLLPYTVDGVSTSPAANEADGGSPLMNAMEQLKWSLENADLADVNVVVFYTYSPERPGTIIDACTAFQHLFQMRRAYLSQKRESPSTELVMQLVPEGMVSSAQSLTITPSSSLVRLCLEVYDRCTIFDGQMPAPSVRLEQAPPRMIDFKSNVNPSPSLMHENSVIHIGYAQSVDERWISAAWTDDRGFQQSTASYCLGRYAKAPSTNMNEVAHEMWESTLEIISAWKVHWRIIITKCSPMSQQEMDFWTGLARTESKATVTVILMTVDTSPSLQLIPPAVKVAPSSSNQFSTTPVSTPQANMVSPEQTANTPATPMRDAAGSSTSINTPAATGAEGEASPNTDTSLIDMTDQTWGAVLAHRLSNSYSLYELRPPVASGYLIKRTGARVEDVPAVMEVNLVHTDASPRAYESLLREVLSHFRALGTLARVRGITDAAKDIRPWHVAVAEKAAQTLYLLM